MSGSSYSKQGTVAVITLDNPPVNAMSLEVRSGVVAGVERAIADPEVKAIVLIGAGKIFSGGADMREFNTPKMLSEPTLLSVIRAIEDSPKPVVAAMQGVAVGGGLELALACHCRVALHGTQVGLPEVKIGLLPGAGGTQRLPRAVGVEAALNMILSGASVPAEHLQGTALFDAVLEGDLLSGAVAFAAKLGPQKLPRRLRDTAIDYPNAEGFFQFARNAVGPMSKGYPAPLKCIDAVSAAVAKPFQEGMRIERELFLQLLNSTESKALRHAFFAEREAAKIPGIPENVSTRPIRTAAVIGAGTMGGGISMCFANAGIPVTVVEMKQEALDKGLSAIRKNYESSAKKGKLSAAQFDQRMGLIRPTLSYGDVAQADIIIEAVFEDMAVKEQVFRKLDEVVKPGAILATNTSTLDVNRIAGFTRRPADVLGTHFFSPAHVMKLLELVRGKVTADDVLATAMELAKKLKKTGVVSGVCDGFIGNRMMDPYMKQALFMLEEGALPQQVDRALEQWGMAMGPFRMIDLAGNDVAWYIRKRHYVEKPHLKYARIADRICELGRFGQKTGAGWYRYVAGKREAIPDPLVEELIAAYRKEIGVTPRKISGEEIVDRCIFGLVNEGAKILEEGIALRSSDIDVVYLTGYGFPPFRGGPMFYADTVGLYSVMRRMKQFAANPHGDPGFWTPAPLLARLATEGKSFTGFGRGS